MAIGDPEHGGEIAQLSLSVYLELMTILGSYREALVLVGGWAPYFILERFGREDTGFRHVGSIDIDIAVNPRLVSPDDYASIVERLERRGYRQRLDKLGQPIPFINKRLCKRQVVVAVQYAVTKSTPLEAYMTVM